LFEFHVACGSGLNWTRNWRFSNLFIEEDNAGGMRDGGEKGRKQKRKTRNKYQLLFFRGGLLSKKRTG